ncbi:MAG: hypothetical protein JXJ04_24220 [Spirochaetales bacterium]|nr:hypothetical protein [Spirochaetales bacterium]
MKKLILAFYFIYLLKSILWSMDCNEIEIILNSSMNEFLLKILYQGDLTEQICIVSQLGRRSDPYIDDFIVGIMEHMTIRDKARYEYLLRVLLDGIFNPDYSEDELAARVTINQKGIKYLVSSLHSFFDPMLRCRIMVLIPYLHDLTSMSILMTRGKNLSLLLEKTNGMPGIQINNEIICLLEIIRGFGNFDYLYLCQSFIRLSRSKAVVNAARETIKIFISRRSQY